MDSKGFRKSPYHQPSASVLSPQLDQQYNQFKLRSIMSEHKKTITAISWCPDNPDLFASASADNLLIVWNVAEKKAVARLDNTKGERAPPPVRFE